MKRGREGREGERREVKTFHFMLYNNKQIKRKICKGRGERGEGERGRGGEGERGEGDGWKGRGERAGRGGREGGG